jgi:hypothetical protein
LSKAAQMAVASASSMANIRQAWFWGKRPELPPGSGSVAAPLNLSRLARRPKTRQMQRAQPTNVWFC